MALAFYAVHLSAAHHAWGAVLNWLDIMGIVRYNPSGEPSLTAASIYSINDRNAIGWLFFWASFLSLMAVVYALIAEYFREPTLYVGVGFILAVCAISHINVFAGLALCVGGTLLAQTIRLRVNVSEP